MAEEIYESKELLKENPDTPEKVLELVQKVISTKDEPKMKLFVLGEILTKNKNDTIYQLKGEIANLSKKIDNQRKHINKIMKTLTTTQAKVQKQNNQMNSISDKIDREAYKKACQSYDNNYSPKKKIVVVKKPYKK